LTRDLRISGLLTGWRARTYTTLHHTTLGRMGAQFTRAFNDELDNQIGRGDEEDGEDEREVGTLKKMVLCRDEDIGLYDDDIARRVLLAFYEATKGDDWVQKHGWITWEEIGSWHGLKLHDTFGVEKMDLPQNNLEGEIVPEVCSLRGLWCIDLSDNSLFGSLPRTIGDLSYLKDLNLSGNQLTGELPRELGRLRPLRRLWLQDNQFEGALPRELGHLFQLREINLSRNRLSGTIPRELGRLEYLENLKLDKNLIEGHIPDIFSSTVELKVLTLSENNLQGLIPRNVTGYLYKLQELDLSHNRLEGPVPVNGFIRMSATLEEVRLVDNNWLGSESELGEAQAQLQSSMPNTNVLLV